MKNRIQAMKKLGRQVAVAVSLALLVSTVAQAGNTWDGGSGANAGWSTAANWTGDVLPTFGSTLDAYFYAVGAGNTLTNYLGTAYTIRSLNFTADADSDVNIRLSSTLTGSTARNLSFGGAGGAAIASDPGAAGNFTLGIAGGNVVLLDNLTISHNAPGSLTISKPITGGYGLTCNGTGVVTLAAANTYSNATVIGGGGALVISADSGLGTAPSTPAPGQLSLTNGALATTASFTLDPNRGIALSGLGGQLNAYSGTLTVGGIIAGAGGLEKAGAGGLTLTNANTYMGGTLLSAGILRVGGSDALGTGPLTIQGNTLLSSTLNTSSNITLTNDITVAGDFMLGQANYAAPLTLSGTLALGSQTRTIAVTNSSSNGNLWSALTGNITGAGGLIKTGTGGLTLNSASVVAFTGDVTLNDGILAVRSASSIGGSSKTLYINGGTLSRVGAQSLTLANPVAVGGNFTILGAPNPVTLTGAINLGSADRTLTAAGTNFILSGSVSGSGGLTIDDSFTASTTALSAILTGSNSFSGSLTLASTVVLSVNSDAAMGAGTNVVISQNANLVASAAVTTAKRLTLTGGNPVIWINSGATMTANGVVGGPSTTPFKSGPGTLVLNATNAFTDGSILLVKDGTLKLGNPYALNGTALKFNPAGSFLDNSSGAALSLIGFQGLEMTSGFTFNGTDDLDISVMPACFVQTTNSSRTVSVAAKTLTIGGILSTGTDYAGMPRLPGALIKSGNGTLVIKGASDYTNGTTVTAGTLRLAANDALPSGGAVTLSGGTLDMGAYACSPSSLNVSTNSALVLGVGQLSFTSQTNAWAGRLTVSGDLGLFTLRFQPALTDTQLGQIDFGGGKFYQTSDGYIHNYPKGTIIRLF